jgi:hypothetical protein
MSLYPENPEIGEVFNNRQWNGTAWVALNNPLSVEYTTDGEFTQHTSASANVHGIVDSESLIYTEDLDPYLTQASASSIYAPSASPTFTGTVGLPLTTNYDGTQLSTTFGSKLNIAGGKILQIVRATDSTDRTTTSASLVDASISVTITPQINTSAVLLIYTARVQVASTDQIRLVITDNSNNTISGSENHSFGAASGGLTQSPVALIAYATPATINATTYKVRFASNNLGLTQTLLNSAATGQLYAIEVSA